MRVDSVFYMALKVKVMVDIDTRTERKKAAEMKKTYVKPIMEMEGFVPNEYVAACYLVTCKLHTGEGSFVYQGEPTEARDEVDTFFYSEGIWGLLKGWWYIDERERYHYVDLEQTTKENNPEHPNASA